MPFITGGHTQYTRRAKTGEYEHRDVVQSLSWSAIETDAAEAVHAFAARVANKAQELVEAAITGKPIATQAEADAPKAKGPGRPPKVQATEDSGSLKATAAPSAEAAGQKITPASTDDLDGPTPAAAAAASTRQASKPAQDDLDDVLGKEPAQVSDKDMVEEVTHVMSKIKNSPAIRALVATYVGGPPKTLRDVPQNKRIEFLMKLKELPHGTA